MSSIRRRILLPLLPAATVALLITAVTIYGAVRRDLFDALDAKLTIMAQGAGSAIDVGFGGALHFEREEVETLGFPRKPGGPFYVIRSRDGAVVASSVSPAPGPYPAGDDGARFGFEAREGRRYRWCTMRVERAPEDQEHDSGASGTAWIREPLAGSPRQSFWVTAGYPTEAIEDALLALRRRLYFGFGGLFIALGVLPAWIVSRASASIRQLSSDADAVGPQSPDRRLRLHGVDREVRPLVAALNRALDRLTTAFERQKRFTADAAHELRTPISALLADCEVTLRRPRTEDELRSALEAAHGAAYTLREIVESLLALSRLEGARSPSEHTPVDLAQVAREAVELNAARAEAKDVSLSAGLCPALPGVGNHRLLVECVSNLLENAVRYTAPGGSVRLECVAVPSPRLTVDDTGIGIPADEQSRIFDRFYRVDKARSRAEGGAGLGLSIAREIARLHGGEILVESEVGKGSRFTLQLPSHPPPEAQP